MCGTSARWEMVWQMTQPLLQQALTSAIPSTFPQGNGAYHRRSPCGWWGRGTPSSALNPFPPSWSSREKQPRLGRGWAPKGSSGDQPGRLEPGQWPWHRHRVRNPRAVGCKWMASADSWYEPCEVCGRPWPNQQPSSRKTCLFTTSSQRVDGPGPPLGIPQSGVCGSPKMAEAPLAMCGPQQHLCGAGFFVSETKTPGVMLKGVHRVKSPCARRGAPMRNVANWQFLCMQTEEELPRGPWLPAL